MAHIDEEIRKSKITYTATGLFIIGAIIFVIGSSLLFTVAKEDLDDKINEKNENSNGLFWN